MFAVAWLSLAVLAQPSLESYGAKPCPEPRDWKSCPDASAAFRSALAAMEQKGEKQPAGRELLVGPFTYRLSQELLLDRAVSIRGESGGWVNGRSRLLFDPGVNGVRVRAAKVVLEDLVIQSSEGRCRKKEDWREGRCRSSSSGVILEAQAHLARVYVTQFPGHGFQVSADKHRTPPTNANGWVMIDCQAVKNSGHGLATEGGDANAGLTLRFQATNNGGWGIHERSFLGNTHLGCGISSNDTGGVFSDKKAARNLFLGCYVESGKIGGRVQLKYPSIWVSGWGTPEGDALWLRDGAFSGGRWAAENNLDPNDTVRLQLGSPNVPHAALELHSSKDRQPYRLEHDVPEVGWWAWRHGMMDGRVPLALSGTDAAGGPGQAWLPNGALIGNKAQRRSVTVGALPERPNKGDVVLAADPEKEGWLGRVCVDPGDPEKRRLPKWRRFGKLEE
jgi:hypothetical protein